LLGIKSVDQETIKTANKKMIINLLYNKRELTKQQIALETGVSIPTVINNVNELIEEGFVEEAGVAPSSGGRKPIIVSFKPNARYSFGVDITLHDFRIILTNLDSEIVDEVYRKLGDGLTADSVKGINKLLANICAEIEGMINKNQLQRERVLGIGFSVPGTVNEEALVLELAPNLSLKNINFKELSEKLQLPVYIENEANAAAFAELRLGVAKDMRNLVYVSITEGMGTGIVVQDYLYKGKNKRAGEFGHMTIVKDGRGCKCGRKGCWERYASEGALLEAYSHEICKDINLESFFQELAKGQSTAVRLWDEYLDYLAAGLQNIILILDPHYIVIGGPISGYEEFLIKPLREKVFIENSFFSAGDTKIFTAKFQSRASTIGAALLPLQKVFFINQKVL
jgi:predicted NBD/HSP70 family sugar kinase